MGLCDSVGGEGREGGDGVRGGVLREGELGVGGWGFEWE